MNTAVKKQLILRLARIQAFAVTLIVVLMPLHAFLSTWLGTVIGPLLVWKSWKELLMLAAAPLALWVMWLRPDIARTIWGRAVNKLIAAYMVLHFVLMLVGGVSAQAVIAGLMFNLRFFTIFILVQIIAEAYPASIAKLRAVAPSFLLWTAIVLGIVAILQVAVIPKDFLAHFGYNKDTTIAPYILVDQNPNALRAFATLRGPNALGAYLLLPVAVAVYRLLRNRRDTLAWAAGALGAVAVGLTGSRSAWLGALLTLIMVGLFVLPRARFMTWARRAVVPSILLLIMVGWAAVNVPAIRLAVFHSSPGDSSLNEGSNDKHWQATARGIADVVRHPLGMGAGSAGPASFYNESGSNVSENYYVQIAQEVGILGLAFFVAICVLAIRYIVRRRLEVLPVALAASFAGISLINIFLHGWADDPTALTWWALAGLFVTKK